MWKWGMQTRSLSRTMPRKKLSEKLGQKGLRRLQYPHKSFWLSADLLPGSDPCEADKPKRLVIELWDVYELHDTWIDDRYDDG